MSVNFIGGTSWNAVAREMETVYARYAPENPPPPHWTAFRAALDAHAEAHPEADALAFRTEMYRLMVEHCQPTLFRGAPFFFEIGMKYRQNWGTPARGEPHSWLLERFRDQPRPPDYERRAAQLDRYRLYASLEGRQPLWHLYNTEGFDNDHFSIGYGRIVPRGLLAIDDDIVRRRADPALDDGQRAELDAMRAGIAAVLAIAARFAARAEAALAAETDPAERDNLARIAHAARRVPAYPPTTFYEGLASILFLREVFGSLEGFGVSLLGRPDLLLAPLYAAGRAAGTLSEAEARRLIGHWMLPHDIKTRAREKQWPETSTCVELGGCDARGHEVFNELTRFFIEEHQRLKLINPKLNCRVSADSTPAYLDLMAGAVLDGHNRFAWLNDDALIPAQLRHGKSLADARNYVNGGCQETICEGVEHSAGGFFYMNLPALFHYWFVGDPGDAPLAEVLPEPLSARCGSFEQFYAGWRAAQAGTIRYATGLAAANGRHFRHVMPGPLLSATLAGCVENACDFTAGGARHNPTGTALLGLADVVNSLYAVRRAVFSPEAFVTLDALRGAVARNWSGAGDEALRLRMQGLPRWGGDDPEVNALAARVVADLAAVVRARPNERGGFYQPSLFVYWFFKPLGDLTRATPDGRRHGDYLAQGISPSRAGTPVTVPEVIRSLSTLDYRDAPGNAVLDRQLPLGGEVSPLVVTAVLRTALKAGIPTIQPNAVNRETLRDARVHPERHGDLVVRVAGLSVVFVRLEAAVQEELLSRAEHAF